MLLELMPADEEQKAEAEAAEAAPKRRRLGLPGRRAKAASADTAGSEKAESAPTKTRRSPARKKTTAGAKEA
jgi:hypothetical protein